MKYNYRKSRARGTVFSIIDSLRKVDANELISGIYFKPTSEFEKWLLGEIEKLLVFSKTKPIEFDENFVKEMKRISEEIKKNKQFNNFYNFVYTAYSTLYTKEIKQVIPHAYYSTLIELSTYLVPVGWLVCGIQTNNKPIKTREIHVDLDKYIWEINQMGDKGILEFDKILRRKGFNVESPKDLEVLLMNERIISNNLFIMAFLVDENYEEFIEKPFYTPNHENLVGICVPCKLFESLEYMQKRTKFLPKDGITLTEIDGTNIEEIYIREKFHLDRVFLMYRLKIGGEYTTGFYDTKDNFFYSLWRDVTQSIGRSLHQFLNSFVLDIYTSFVSERETDLFFKTDLVEIKKEEGDKKYNFDGEYNYELRGIDYQIRKLPIGYTASEESLKLAERYGIKLAEGYTFVRPHTKNVRVKK